jgi:hypothetical protein
VEHSASDTSFVLDFIQQSLKPFDADAKDRESLLWNFLPFAPSSHELHQVITLPINLFGISQILKTDKCIVDIVSRWISQPEVVAWLGVKDFRVVPSSKTVVLFRRAMIGGVKFSCEVNEMDSANRDCFALIRDSSIRKRWFMACADLGDEFFLNSLNFRDGSLLNREDGLVPVRVFGFVQVVVGAAEDVGILRFALVRYLLPVQFEQGSDLDFGPGTSTWRNPSLPGSLKFHLGFRDMNDMDDCSLVPLTSFYCKCAAYFTQDNTSIVIMPVLTGS